jgi:Holliday junction resolvasome RuvABC endonuclease subunit
MVLHVQAAAIKSEAKQSTDQRLVKLEAKLEARLDKLEEESRSFESTVSMRLQKLEELLERVLVAVTPAT